jgi:hypothetical protein
MEVNMLAGKGLWCATALILCAVLWTVAASADPVMNVNYVASASIPYEFHASQTSGDTLYLYDYAVSGSIIQLKRGFVDPEGSVGPQTVIFNFTADPAWGALNDQPVDFTCKNGKLYSIWKAGDSMLVFFTDFTATVPHIFDTSGMEVDPYNPGIYIVDENLGYLCGITGWYPQFKSNIYSLNFIGDYWHMLHQVDGYNPYHIESFGDEYYLFWTQCGPDLFMQNNSIIQEFPNGWIQGASGFSRTSKLCVNYYQTIVYPDVEEYDPSSFLVWLEGGVVYQQFLHTGYIPLSFYNVITHSDSTFSAIYHYMYEAEFCHKTLVDGIFSDLDIFPDLGGYQYPIALLKLDGDYSLAISRVSGSDVGFHLIDYPMTVVRSYAFSIMNNNDYFWSSRKIMYTDRSVYILGKTDYYSDWQVHALKLELGSDADDDIIPGVQAELAVAPNPFRERCRIEFTCKSPCEARMEIFNLRGQKVREIFNGTLDTGVKAFEWDGRDEDQASVSSGVYFIRFTAGNDCINRRVLMIK